MAQTPIAFTVPASPHAEAVMLGAAAPASRVLGVPYVSQTVSNWCWATCATMLSRFVTGSSLKICEAASTLIPNDGCCAGAPPEGTFDGSWKKGGCNRTCTVAEVAQLHGLLGMSSTHVGAAVDFDALRDEIAGAGRPVEIAFSWFGGGGHVAIAQGVDAGARTVNVNDPWPDTGQTVVAYDKLKTAYGLGSWFDAWTGVAAAGA